MAAYAAVVSVMNNIEQMQNHPVHSFSFDKEQIESLHRNAGFLLDFLESYSHAGGQEAEDLVSQIASAAQEADDVIESHIVDQIIDGSSLHIETHITEMFKHFVDFLGTHYHEGGEKAETSESQIASAAQGADEAIESHVVDEIIAGSSLDMERDFTEMFKHFMDFLETRYHEVGEKAETSESQIASAAQGADNVIESHIVDEVIGGSTLRGGTSPGESSMPHHEGSGKEESSESQIASAAQGADDVIESHIVDEIIGGSTLHGGTSPGESSMPHEGSRKEETSESQIASAAQGADDVIESHIDDQILAGSSLDVKMLFLEMFKRFIGFMEIHSHEGSKKAETSESQIASAAQLDDDAIKSHIADEIIARSTHGETNPGKSSMPLCVDFPETYSHGGSKEAEASESQIASAVHEADDVISSFVVDQILAGSTLHEITSHAKMFKYRLQDLMETSSPGGSKEAEAHDADDVIKSRIVDQILAARSALHGETSRAVAEQILSRLEAYLETSSHGGSEEAEDSESQTAAAAHEANDEDESHTVDEIHAALSAGETSLREQIISRLQDFLEISSRGGREEAEASESQTASAAHEANNAFNSHIVDDTLYRERRPGKQTMPLSQDSLETYSHGSSKEAEASKSQIASAAHEAESHTPDQSLAGSTLHGETSSSFSVDLQKVIENMDCVKQVVMKVEAQRELKPYSAPAASSRPLTTGKNDMVGFDDELNQLLDLLTGLQSSRQVNSITGMGGIGKTTLAKNVYENSLIVHHFDIRIWATISQEYSTKKNLSELVLCLGKSDAEEIDQKTEDELGEQLYKALSGRRYLIILDDIWSVEAWDSIRVFFPDNNNRSRIVITSRQSDVANHLGSSCIALKFLDEEKSWILFCQKTFSGQDCPPELEETGKKIVERCKGLPLLIVLIGGHLANNFRTEQYWESVAKDINSILDSGEDEQCFDILTLSYKYLPAHLKPCFLYMGNFPEDHEISVSTLVKLWVAEGFLKPSKAQTFEEVAERCLYDLVDRNLISVRKLRWNGRIKTCSIHDLLRELCLKVATKERFLCVLKLHQLPPPIDKERRLIFHASTQQEERYPEIFHALESAHLTRSLICYGKSPPLSIDSKLLKVMQSAAGVVDEDDETLMVLKLQQVNLRYVHCKLFHLTLLLFINLIQVPPKPVLPLCLPLSISMIWNLQTLIINEYPIVLAPLQIWRMPQLRHIAVSGLHMEEPPQSDQPNGFLALENLQTLSEVRNFRFSEDVCKRIPNVKKLHVRYMQSCEEHSSYYSPQNIGCLQKLESLRCSFSAEANFRRFFLSFAFPSSLQKLCLISCDLHWDDLTMIGSLPNLEVLKFLEHAVVGSEWNPVEGEFLRLKFLKISSFSDLIYWNAESCHFPALERLDFEGLSALDEIPSDIGEIPTLQFIRLKYCSVSSAVSAMRILVEQESLGNEDLQVEVMFSNEEQLESFREIVQEEDLSSSNLHLHC